MSVMGRESWDAWISDYSKSHQHPINKMCHTVGIPMVAGSVVLGVTSLFVPPLIMPAAVLFVVGWIFQFIGHAYEGKRPEFMNDPRFLLVGLRWWFAKVQGQV